MNVRSYRTTSNEHIEMAETAAVLQPDEVCYEVSCWNGPDCQTNHWTLYFPTEAAALVEYRRWMPSGKVVETCSGTWKPL